MSYEAIVERFTGPGQVFEIVEQQVEGRPVKTWRNLPAHLGEVLAASRQFGEREFLVQGEVRVSYQEFHRAVAALTRSLQAMGVVKGDRVAIAMANRPEWVQAFWATVAMGAIAVPLNGWWRGDELAYGLGDSGAKVLFADGERLARLEGRVIHSLETRVAVGCPRPPAGAVAFEALLAGPADSGLPAVAIAPDDPATLFYTSGTTGFPKGALGSHRNFCSAAMAMPFNGLVSVLRQGGGMAELAQLQQVRQVALVTVPLFHVTGCQGVMLSMMGCGGKLVLMPRWDGALALDLIERERVTLFGGVPTMVWHLLGQPDIASRDLGSIINLGYGGAPAAPEMLRRIRETLPNAGASNGWGITETSSTITTIGGLDYLERPDSVGRPLPIYDLKVVDGAGRELPPGAIGELWVRGPTVVKGYWNKPEATAAAFSDGWFHTGDVGRIDSEGFVYILDRLKDMIIRGGENIYCAEVEAALLEHPAVTAVAVFGLPHPELGEEVAAAVETPDPAALEAGDLQAWCAARLARFKVPSRWWLRVEPLPLGATGKVQKKELRQACLDAVASATSDASSSRT